MKSTGCSFAPAAKAILRLSALSPLDKLGDQAESACESYFSRFMTALSIPINMLENLEKHKELLNDIELTNEEGVFRMKAKEGAEISVEIESKEGKKVVLNDLLPEGWTMINAEMQTKADYEKKEVWINTNEANIWGWEYVLTVLHEIGHAVISESDDKQKEAYKEFLRMREQKEELKTNPKLMDSINSLHSKIERDAWAHGIRKFGELMEDLGMDPEAVFSSNEELMEHAYDWLISYKEWGMTDIKNMDITEEDKEKLIENIFKLYTHKNARKR